MKCYTLGILHNNASEAASPFDNKFVTLTQRVDKCNLWLWLYHMYVNLFIIQLQYVEN